VTHSPHYQGDVEMADCQCGGMHRKHYVGEGDCYRELVEVEKEPFQTDEQGSMDTQYWIVNGDLVTEVTLREQRMYSQHEDGRWSKVKGVFSENSLPDNT